MEGIALYLLARNYLRRNSGLMINRSIEQQKLVKTTNGFAKS